MTPTDRARVQLVEHYGNGCHIKRAEVTVTSTGGYLLVWRCGGSRITLSIGATDYNPARRDTDAYTVRDTLNRISFWGDSKMDAEPTAEMVGNAVRALFGEVGVEE